MKKVFEDLGRATIWVVVHYEGDVITGLEEHDHYAGGNIWPNGRSWAEALVEVVQRRLPHFSEEAEEFAKQFIN